MKKKFDVEITETLQRTVTVEAESYSDAISQVKDAYDHEEFVLDADNCMTVDFEVVAEREKTITALLVQPGKFPKPITIEDTLEAKQQIVGGYIQAVYPFEDDVAIICNEEGKINGLPYNRALYDDICGCNGQMYDIIAGDFLVVGVSEDDFASLSPELMKKFERKFHYPEMFWNTGRSILAVPMHNEFQCYDRNVDEGNSPPSLDDDELER